MKKEILRMDQVTIGNSEPYFLDHFRLSIYEGEIVNLIGMSGAGKSLLLHYFYGNIAMKEGRVLWQGREYGAGKNFVPDQQITCIGQQSSLVQKMTVAENIFILSRKRRSSPFVSGNVNYRAKLLLGRYAPQIRPDMLVAELTPFQKLVVTLLRAIENETKIVIIDDIFQSFGYQEVLMIKELLLQMKALKISILYESHRSDFMLQISDRILILRKGSVVRTFYQEDYNEELARQLMIGNELPREYSRSTHKGPEEVLNLVNYSCGESIQNLNLTLHQGEIIGLYDQENYANKELVLSLIGESPITQGMAVYNGIQYIPKDLDFAIKNNIGYLPRNMTGVSLVESMSFTDNLFLPVMKKTSRFGFFNEYSVLNFLTKEYRESLGISENDKELNVRSFDAYIHNSILLTRWRLFRPNLMLCLEPCANADMLMQNIIYDSMEKMASEKTAILISSSDINELLPICDVVYSVNDKGYRIME